jgi:CubicO group peptidase (beta-lactamase class C family)
MKINIIILFGFIAGIFNSCISDTEMKLPYKGYTPSVLNDGWTTSTPQDEGINRKKLEALYKKFHSEEEYITSQSLIIIKNSNIIAEAYFRDNEDQKYFHNIQSATKSVTAMLLGIAIDKGQITSEQDAIYSYLPGYFDSDTTKRNITISNALTMQAGLKFNNEIDTETLVNTSDSSIQYVLEKELEFIPGTRFKYNDGAPQLISGIIQKSTGMTEEQFALINILSPLGIKNYQWEKAKDGVTFGAFSLWLLPRDMAKIGQLCLQDGNWKGTQLISSTWINKMQQPHVRPTGYFPYGYYWWLVPEQNIYFAEGHGSQAIIVIPDYNMVVIHTADSYANAIIAGIDWDELFYELIDLNF